MMKMMMMMMIISLTDFLRSIFCRHRTFLPGELEGGILLSAQLSNVGNVMISRIGIPEQSMTKTVLVHVFLAQENCLRMVLSVDSRARNRICICDLETGP